MGSLSVGRHNLNLKEHFLSQPKADMHITPPGDLDWFTPGYDWEHFEANESVAELRKFFDESRKNRDLSRRFRLRGILVEKKDFKPGTGLLPGNGFGYQKCCRRMLLVMGAE